MVHGPVREVVRGPGPLDWSMDRGSVFSGHPRANELLELAVYTMLISRTQINRALFSLHAEWGLFTVVLEEMPVPISDEPLYFCGWVWGRQFYTAGICFHD